MVVGMKLLLLGMKNAQGENEHASESNEGDSEYEEGDGGSELEEERDVFQDSEEERETGVDDGFGSDDELLVNLIKNKLPRIEDSTEHQNAKSCVTLLENYQFQ